MKTFTKVLNLLLVTGLFGVVYVSASTHEAPAAGWSGNADQIAENIANLPVNVPTFNASDAREGCTERPTAPLHATVRIVDQQNNRKTVSFDEAFERTRNTNVADDLWVVGFCS